MKIKIDNKNYELDVQKAIFNGSLKRHEQAPREMTITESEAAGA
jgi:hypothetical protein